MGLVPHGPVRAVAAIVAGVHLEKVLRYPGTPAAVAALLADPDFIAEVCAASGALEWHVDVTGHASGAFSVVSSRHLPAEHVPEPARRLLGRNLKVRESDRWAAPAVDGSREGSLDLELPGAPVRARATMTLRPDGAGGAVQVLHGEIHATVPLVGARVERTASGPLLEALDQLEELAAARLRD